MELTIDNTRLRKLIPGVIHEVRNESTLYDKLHPWLLSAKQWIEDEFLGPDFTPPPSILPLAEKIIVNRAFAQAIPSLDLVLSPAGFAVISTDGRAPASKERIERLIESLRSFVDANSDTLLSQLCAFPEWRETPHGQYWCGTFLPGLSEAFRFRSQYSLLDTYRIMRVEALGFEKEIAEQYIGSDTLSFLRSQQFVRDSEYTEIITMIRAAEISFISCRMGTRSRRPACPDPHPVWHSIRPILARLRYYPQLYGMWQAEMGDSLTVRPFINNIRGGYYF